MLIHDFCENGDLNGLKSLIARASETEKTQLLNELTEAPEEYSPLIIAAKYGYFEIVKYLVEEGAEINPKNATHYPLRAATIGGNLEVVKYLLENGSNIDEKSKGNRTPLQGAIFYNHPKVVELLLCCGANIDIKNDFNETALDIAVLKGFKDIEYLILQYKKVS